MQLCNNAALLLTVYVVIACSEHSSTRSNITRCAKFHQNCTLIMKRFIAKGQTRSFKTVHFSALFKTARYDIYTPVIITRHISWWMISAGHIGRHVVTPVGNSGKCDGWRTVSGDWAVSTKDFQLVLIKAQLQNETCLAMAKIVTL